MEARGAPRAPRRFAHAGAVVLDTLEPLLARVRELEGLKERKRGSFDSRLRVSLHFHEDVTGLFADLRVQDDTKRLPVTTKEEQGRLIEALSLGLQLAKQRQRGKSAASL
jgi:hypothetical protein